MTIIYRDGLFGYTSLQFFDLQIGNFVLLSNFTLEIEMLNPQFPELLTFLQSLPWSFVPDHTTPEDYSLEEQEQMIESVKKITEYILY